MASQEDTLYEVRDRAAWITLNRPEARNALSAGLVTELYDHLEAANSDDAVRCIVLTGNGKAFCAGADLKNPPGQASSGGRAVTYPEVLAGIWEGPKPVIAAVNGAAFAGGLGLVGAADIVITSEVATFSFSEVKIGVIPAIISVVCLRKLGPHHGMRLFLTGDRFDGKQAVDYGLAHKAVPPDELAAAVQQEIDAIALGAPNAVVECKKLVRAVPELSLREGFERTEKWSAELFRSKEAREGMAAFREKRKPSWVTD
ncbi:MAG: enoyl-CoA hydratase/isomerase family protein [Myxococcales bacterium]|nr:enoyl-CoA hydratase/isomerase family protein [Myxococcales bacterium]